MVITAEIGDITKVPCDAIVNPANSYGYMGGGVAGAIKKAGGSKIEEEAISKAPIKVGSAIATTGGQLPCKYVIHAPTMKEPAMRINVDNVKLATEAAFELGLSLKLKCIVIPGMGTGVGGVSYENAAKAIVDIAKKYEANFNKIILLDRNEEMVNQYNKNLI